MPMLPPTLRRIGVLQSKSAALAYGLLSRRIHSALHHDLSLTKKLVKRVQNLLTDSMKKKMVKLNEAPLLMVCCHSMAMLNNIVTMNESTPKTKV